MPKSESDVFVLDYMEDEQLDSNDVVGCAGCDIQVIIDSLLDLFR